MKKHSFFLMAWTLTFFPACGILGQAQSQRATKAERNPPDGQTRSVQEKPHSSISETPEPFEDGAKETNHVGHDMGKVEENPQTQPGGGLAGESECRIDFSTNCARGAVESEAYSCEASASSGKIESWVWTQKNGPELQNLSTNPQTFSARLPNRKLPYSVSLLIQAAGSSSPKGSAEGVACRVERLLNFTVDAVDEAPSFSISVPEQVESGSSLPLTLVDAIDAEGGQLSAEFEQISGPGVSLPPSGLLSGLDFQIQTEEVAEAQSLVFDVHVTDGTSTVSKRVSVEILQRVDPTSRPVGPLLRTHRAQLRQ